jgi:hypothetical protein
MKRLKPIFIFVLLSMAVFWILFLVGPQETYGKFYRAVSNTVFGSFGKELITKLEPYESSAEITKDTKMNVGKKGAGYVGEMPIDSKRQAYIPTVLFIALIITTPIAWKQRGLILGIGMCILQFIIFITLSIGLIRGFTMAAYKGRALLELPAYGDWILRRLDKFLSEDPYTIIIFTILLWVLLVARFADFNKLWPASPAEAEPAEDS